VTIDSKREQFTEGPGNGASDDQAPVSAAGEGYVSKAGYADFFARVAHDLRSPLGIVMHVLQRLEADLGKELNDEQRVLMRLGARGVKRLQGFVERVGVLSELELDELETNLQPLDLGKLVKRCIDSNDPRSEVNISYDAPANACIVLGDENQLSRVVRELLTNAVAHARRQVRVGVVAEPAGAAVFVEDDGAGLSEEARSTMYRRFVVREAHGGLGIGLSIAQDLARVHSGEIRVEDSSLPPGRPGTVGARFVLSLPHTAVAPNLG
jgi:signal transduction histidine kinase